MASPPPQPAPGCGLPARCTFYPEDDVPVLLSDYLRRRIARQPLPAGTAMFFHEADVYAADPAALVADYLPAPGRKGENKRWFFFSPARLKSSRGRCKSRTVGDNLGTWQVDRTKDVIDGEGRLVGYRQNFFYKPKGGGRRVWLMTEFGVDQEDGDGDGDGDKEVLVLCKIYQSPRAVRAASNSSSSGSSRKRVATDGRPDHPAARRRLVLDPPAPTPPAASHAKNAATLESPDNLLVPVEAEPEAEESHAKNATMESSDSFLDFWFSLSVEPEPEALPLPSCYGTPVLRPCSSGSATGGSSTAGNTMDPADEKFWRSLGFLEGAL